MNSEVVLGAAIFVILEVYVYLFNSPVYKDPRLLSNTVLRKDIKSYLRDNPSSTSKYVRNIGPKYPEAYDVRVQYPGLVALPYDQDKCGSCWAFALALAASDSVRIEGKGKSLNKRVTYKLPDGSSITRKNNLSPYHFASCDLCLDEKLVEILGSKCNNGCDGGVLAYALQYVKDYGLVDMGCDSEQIYSCEKKISCARYKADSFHRVSLEEYELSSQAALKRNMETIMDCLMTHHNITVGYVVYDSFGKFFISNPTGIYMGPGADESDRIVGGHAVNIVGWGVGGKTKDYPNGIPYWIVRNSWGPRWGDNGFFKILKGENICSFESDVWSVIMRPEPVLGEIEGSGISISPIAGGGVINPS
jgi:hypothetical protein